jgi:hypothetical protein
VLEHYRARPTFRVVNGAQAQAKVAADVDRMIDAAAASSGGTGGKGGPVHVAGERHVSARVAE